MISYQANRGPGKKPLLFEEHCKPHRVEDLAAATPALEACKSSGVLERLLGISEVKKQLGVGRTTIWKLIDEEQLEKVKVRRRTLVTQTSVSRYIAELVEEARRKREAGSE